MSRKSKAAYHERQNREKAKFARAMNASVASIR